MYFSRSRIGVSKVEIFGASVLMEVEPPRGVRALRVGQSKSLDVGIGIFVMHSSRSNFSLLLPVTHLKKLAYYYPDYSRYRCQHYVSDQFTLPSE